MTEALVDRIRKSLEDEHAHLLEQIDRHTPGGEIDLDFDGGFADSAQVAAEKGENRSIASSLDQQLDAVDAALARIEAGTFGTCVSCGSGIGDARLEAMPAATDCINCA